MVKTVDGSYFCINIVWLYVIDKFPLLGSVALGALTIPHSNASEEHVFQ